MKNAVLYIKQRDSIPFMKKEATKKGEKQKIEVEKRGSSLYVKT